MTTTWNYAPVLDLLPALVKHVLSFFDLYPFLRMDQKLMQWHYPQKRKELNNTNEGHLAEDLSYNVERNFGQTLVKYVSAVSSWLCAPRHPPPLFNARVGTL